ncbi:hypothetical protein PDTK01_32620 [Phycicoccus sp. DTK01]|nr:hypothetical protein PDTK01_32620 [Phycicoccus sp. DTK01]
MSARCGKTKGRREVRSACSRVEGSSSEAQLTSRGVIFSIGDAPPCPVVCVMAARTVRAVEERGRPMPQRANDFRRAPSGRNPVARTRRTLPVAGYTAVGVAVATLTAV